MSNLPKWDVQHHILPDFYVQELKKMGVSDIEGVRYPRWSIQSTLKLMKSWNIERAILSLSLPGVHFGDDVAACRLASQVNDEILAHKKRLGSQIGGFASLPLPNVKGALAEYERAVITEGLDGVILMSNVNGTYPGNEQYRPLFERMNADNAVVFIHPNTPVQSKGHGLINPFYTWFLDTTKAFLSLLTSGFHQDYPNIRYVFAHGGGFVSRLAADLELSDPKLAEELKLWRSQLFFDTAKFVTAEALNSLLSFTSSNRVLFSSDFPWASQNKMPYWTSKLEAKFADPKELSEIYLKNSKALFDQGSNLPNLGDTLQSPKHDPVHAHAMPQALAEEISGLGIDASGIQWFKKESFTKESFEKESLSKTSVNISSTNQPMPVALDLPELWAQEKEKINRFITKYNHELSKLAGKHSGLFSAFGAVNISDPEAALTQIADCISSANISGLCLYPSINETALPTHEVILELSKAQLPIMIHPQDSTGAIILNEQKMVATQFMAELMYSGQIELFKKTHFILAHSAGTHRDIADSLGMLYYLRKQKWHLVRFAYDYFIKRKLKGESILLEAQWD